MTDEPSPIAAVAQGWEEGRLVYPRDAEGRPIWPPFASAPGVGGEVEWATSAGRGMVYSVTTGPRADGGGMQHLGLVELDEGFRMMSRIVSASDNSVPEIGQRVEVVFVDDVALGRRLPEFQIVEGELR